MVLLQHLEQGIRPITRYYNPMTYSNTHASLLHGFPSTAATSSSKLFFRNSAMKQKSKVESKEIAAKKHSDAERRRRLRINCQFATLRTILPNLAKDKASVLGETVRYLNELKKTVKDIEMAAPRLEDDLKLSQCNRGLAKVVFSCSDRKGLMSEIAESLATTKGKAVRAEIMTVGGRTKCALYVQGVNGNEGMVRLKKALKPILNRDLSKNNRITTFHQSS
ncbi:PREDICTED: transcription factor bHLH131 isoform X2 [Tarenaya hassleriana]|uniref:transcription factor bHLH131 isoform X2 n=1 Tax=Tarenaya hassleriana TaxID=28532 RepID=UPI00053C7868|nr:PREDICTED: transcription factor bHLH131 isoform X2 [Tarenaya hassleriana]